MTARLAHIRRHPIKSVGGEGLERIDLRPARRLPGDREWAILTEAGERHAIASQTNGQPDRWLPKTCFLRGAAAGALQAIKGGWQGDHLVLHAPGRDPITFDPTVDGDALIGWLQDAWPAHLSRPTRLVKGAAIWTDVKFPWISILSLDSLNDLEQRAGKTLGINRWRGNLWIDGWDAFAERDLIGRVIRIADLELRVAEQIGRCAATSADTETGLGDIEMLDFLKAQYGHTDFGVYAEVVTGGRIAIGDAVTS